MANRENNSKRYLISAPATVQIFEGPGVLGRLFISVVGSGATITVYDNIGSDTTNPLWVWATADGRISLEIDVPIVNGLKIVGSTTTNVKGFITYTS